MELEGDEAAEGDEVARFSIETRVMVKRRCAGKPWLPETKEIDGVTFFKLHRWERASTSILTGKTLQLSASKPTHFLDQKAIDRIFLAACDLVQHEMYRRVAWCEMTCM